MDVKTEPLISISVITYNQEKYIAETLDGILSQKVNFEMEIVITDDCSTDNTTKICLEYAAKHNTIKFYNNTVNTGMMINFMENINKCSGKYIAICEGDDFWTDKNKLQVQVDFLEQNPSFVGAFHNVSVVENGVIVKQERFAHTKDVFYFDDIIVNNPVPTLSLVFRNVFKNNYPSWITDCKIADWPLLFCLVEKGPFKYFKSVMGCYRVHPQGSFFDTSKINWYKKVMIPTFEILEKNAASKLQSKKIHARKIEELTLLNIAQRNKWAYRKNIMLLMANKRYTRFSYRDLLYLLRNFKS